MILEVARILVRAGQADVFEAMSRQAQATIAGVPGYLAHEFQRRVEREGEYLLLVRWRTLADHRVGFRGSSEYQRWKALLHHFHDPFPAVSHYEAVAGTPGA